MSDKIFLDTNVLVYAFGSDSSKRIIAENLLLREDIVMSSQVVGEFVAVTSRKQILKPAEILLVSRNFLRTLPVVGVTGITVSLALDVMTKYQFAYWDSLILAAALESHCTLVYSEDLQSGQRIEDRLVIVNPFE